MITDDEARKLAEEVLNYGDVEKKKLAHKVIELLDRQRWIPVSEILPEIDQYVLWYCPDGHLEIWEIDKDMDWNWCKDRYGDETPTHWMPLPQPPEQQP